MPTFCPVVCPQQRPPACAAAGCRTAQCPWAEQLHAVREGALWGLAQRALQEAEQGELNSEGLGRIRVLVAEGARGHTLPVNFHRVPPFYRDGLSRFSWPLAFRVGATGTSDCLAAAPGAGAGAGAPLLSSLLPSPSPFPESAPRGCHVHFCLYPYLNFAQS